ncbi:hypothetical protein [Streptococcus mutans]|uniref:hypothetical protein n=1 Tax=Streptococcus mutans TaxID=1309 RepID=UPI0018AA0EA9|nr:hypothetical protein [Streptococcus mutans]
MNSLVFEEFETLGADYLVQVNGSGLGLSLLYRAAYTTSEAFSYRCAGAGIGSLGVG